LEFFSDFPKNKEKGRERERIGVGAAPPDCH